MSFMVTAMLISWYNMNIPLALKLLRAKFIYFKIIEQDGSISDFAYKVKQLKYSNLLTRKNYYYIVTGYTEFHKDNRPCYCYYYNNPMPLTLKQFIEKTISVGDKQVQVTNVFLGTKKTDMDSKQLHDSINTKIVTELMSLPIDKFTIISMLLSGMAMVVSIIAIMYIFQLLDGMQYMNKLIENIAKSANVPLPEIKPSILR